MNYTYDWLVDNGWQDGEHLALILDRAHMLAEKIGNEKYILKQLRRDFAEFLVSWDLRDSAAPCAEAIEIETEEEKKNYSKVKMRMEEILRSPVVVAGAVMPDACPAGNEFASLPVGGVVEVKNALLPAAHSLDICCSMFATFYSSDLPVGEELDQLQEITRFGPGMRPSAISHPVVEENVWANPFLRGLKDKAKFHIADQGDGNHFASIGELTLTAELLEELDGLDLSEDAASYIGQSVRVLVTHHGSRGLGAAVFKRGLDKAVQQTRKVSADMPEAACWLAMDTQEGVDYWEALQYVGRWTRANHQSIHKLFIEGLDASSIVSFGNEHNFVWQRGDSFFHAKGATPAWLDESGRGLLGLIPLNMAEPILLVRGASNAKFLEFAPHGAGRNLSRSALLSKYRRKAGLSAEGLNNLIDHATAGLDIRWYLGEPDLTESPIAYKPAKKVIEQIHTFGLARVLAKIVPLGCIMAGRSPKREEKPLTPKQERQIQHRKERRKAKQRNWQEWEER